MQYYWNINDLIRVKNIIEKERLRRWMVRDEKKKKRKKEKNELQYVIDNVGD